MGVASVPFGSDDSVAFCAGDLFHADVFEYGLGDFQGGIGRDVFADADFEYVDAEGGTVVCGHFQSGMK